MIRPLRRLGPGLLALGLIALSAAAPARAQVTLFTNRAAFTAAAPGLTTIDFNDQVTPPATFFNHPGNTVTLSGVTFTADQILFAVTPAFSAGYDLGDGTVLSWQATSGSTLLSVALPAGITAVGMDFGSFGGGPLTFTLSTGDVYTLTSSVTPTATPTFAGFISAAPLTGLTIFDPNGADNVPQIDRFAFGAAAPAAAVPEPGTLALLVGLAPIGLVVRRRRRG